MNFCGSQSDNPNLTLRLTPVGCGVAGYKPTQIAPMFRADAAANIIMPDEFKHVISIFGCASFTRFTRV
jgi:hypothetical protein